MYRNGELPIERKSKLWWSKVLSNRFNPSFPVWEALFLRWFKQGVGCGGRILHNVTQTLL
jgi:hypothetical protein